MKFAKKSVIASALLLTSIALSAATLDVTEIKRKKSIEDFETAVSSFNVDEVGNFFKKTDSSTLDYILNQATDKRSPGFIELLSIAYQIEEENGLELIKKALEHGADVTRSFNMLMEEGDKAATRTECPFSVAALLSYVTGNTRIIEVLVEHGAVKKMSSDEVTAIIDGWYSEMKRSFQTQFDAQSIGDEEIKRSVLLQFDTVRDSLTSIVATKNK